MSAEAVIDRFRHRPLVLGHRGARAYAPMNTLASFTLAMEMGADGVELDVWRSKDGHLVVIHDETVDGTTNGQGRVQDLTLAQLRALDAGAWFHPKFAGAMIPTLDEVFEALPKAALVNVEIKKSDNFASETDGIEALVADCIARHAAFDRVIVSSFSLSALRHFRALRPRDSAALGFLFPFGDPFAIMGDLAGEVQFLHPYYESITADSMQAARERGLIVNTWTVNDEPDMRRLVALGVGGLISDKPDTARAIVDEVRGAAGD